MRLTELRVQNFKCIEDSTEFRLAPVTCLVGKNEAGKSALLQAAYKLNPDVKEQGAFDETRDYPRRRLVDYQDRLRKSPGAKKDNVLTTNWEMDEGDSSALEKALKIEISIPKIVITKGYDNERKWEFKLDEKEVVNKLIKMAQLGQDDEGQLMGTATIKELIVKLEANKSASQSWTALLNTVKQGFPDSDLKKAVVKVLETRIPHFLYFADYQKMPGQVAVNDFLKRKSASQLGEQDRIFVALLDLVGSNAEELNSMTRFEPLIAKLEAISNRLSQEVFQFWTQNKHLSVEFRFDSARPEDPPPFNAGWIFRTRIKNIRHGVTVNFDERSSGFVWFFSFLIWFSQVQRNYGDNLVILLDEPALSLHAKAQADWLRYINERLKGKYQVVYTTHSPFMVDPDNLLNVRTIEDVVQDGNPLGTQVGDQVLSSDRDTLFPLQAALGYDITQTLFVGKHTLLVEGPGDLLYLKWFSEELKRQGRQHLDPRWVISPAGGIDKVASFVTLFGGNKLNVVVFTDIRKGQKQKVRNLRESDILKQGHVLCADMYCGQEDADIEDVIGRPFYIHLVNKCYGLGGSHTLKGAKAPNAPSRVVEEVEGHFAVLPSQYQEFDHYTPASYLIENCQSLLDNAPGYDEALARFEKLFADVNRLLPDG